MWKIFVITLLLLISLTAFSQNLKWGGAVGVASVQEFTQVYYKATFGTSTLDTTSWFNIEPCSELAFIVDATDSCVADFTFQGRSSFLSNANQYTSYADSITLADSVAGGANSGERRYVLIKTTTLNRLNQPVKDQCRIIFDNRAGNGTTTGRTQKMFMVARRP